MTCHEYEALYGIGTCYTIKTEPFVHKDNRNSISLKQGMIQFDEDSACAWGGPFPGNFAYYLLQDWRVAKRYNEDSLIIAGADAFAELNIKKHREGCSDEKFNLVMEMHYRNEYPTESKPFRLYMCGNDDTSYSRNFTTAEEALYFIELMEACQSLNMFDDIQNCFASTN